MDSTLPAVLGIVASAGILIKLVTRRHCTNITDKVVLITGASSGLGEACAHAFYREGCKVILCARRQDQLERVRDELLASNVQTTTHHPEVLTLDLAQLDSLESKAQEALKIHGKVDILVNNGGVSYRGTMLDTDLDVHIKVMTVNYLGQVALTRAILPSMVAAGGGHIVAVSSMQGRIALPYRSAYGASKHALQAFCDSLRAEVAHHGIRVSVSSPGYIRTNLSLNSVTGDGSAHGVMDSTQLSGYPPEEVASRIVRLVREQRNEDIPAPLLHRLVIYIRTLFPSLFFFIMQKRAKSQRKEKAKND